jgi:NitT/TauT family transport system permease protein
MASAVFPTPPPATTLTGRRLRALLVLLAVWEVVVRVLYASPLIFPPASDVLVAWVHGVSTGEILSDARQSLQVLVAAMAVATVIALVLAMSATMSPTWRDLLETLTGMFNPLPAIALLPLALLWLGLGTNSLLFVLVHSVLWPQALNADTGFVTVPITLVLVGQNIGLSGRSLAAGILLSAAFPYLLTGLKIGWALPGEQ